MRHGEARQGGPDFDRELTIAGVEGVNATARVAVERNVRPGRVISSPLVRARQTATIMMEALKLEGQPEFSKALIPSGSPAGVADLLSQLDGDEVMLVTHEPLAGKFISYLSDERASMGTAALACLTADVPARHLGMLEWIIGG